MPAHTCSIQRQTACSEASGLIREGSQRLANTSSAASVSGRSLSPRLTSVSSAAPGASQAPCHIRPRCARDHIRPPRACTPRRALSAPCSPASTPVTRANAEAVVPLGCPALSPARPARSGQVVHAPPAGPGAVQRLRLLRSRRERAPPVRCRCLVSDFTAPRAAANATDSAQRRSAEKDACIAYDVVYGTDYRAVRAHLYPHSPCAARKTPLRSFSRFW